MAEKDGPTGHRRRKPSGKQRPASPYEGQLQPPRRVRGGTPIEGTEATPGKGPESDHSVDDRTGRCTGKGKSCPHHPTSLFPRGLTRTSPRASPWGPTGVFSPEVRPRPWPRGSPGGASEAAAARPDRQKEPRSDTAGEAPGVGPEGAEADAAASGVGAGHGEEVRGQGSDQPCRRKGKGRSGLEGRRWWEQRRSGRPGRVRGRRGLRDGGQG